MSGKSSPSVSTSTYGVITLRFDQSRCVEIPNHRYGSPPNEPDPAPAYWMSPARSDWFVQQSERIDTVHSGSFGLVAPSSMIDVQDTYASCSELPCESGWPSRSIWPGSVEDAVTSETGFAAAYAGTRSSLPPCGVTVR